MNKPIPVLFRVYQGELCAYFPSEAWGDNLMTCYAAVGQHGGACPSFLHRGRPATPDEYSVLLAELRDIYEHEPGGIIPLRVVKRASAAMRRERLRQTGGN